MQKILAIAIIVGLVGSFHALATAAGGKPSPSPAPSTVAATTRIPEGFAPPARSDFAPILELVSPGPRRAERAMAALDRQLEFQRQALHPEYSPALEDLFGKIPPRNSTLIRAASLYSDADIPWDELDGKHQLCAEASPRGENLYVTTSPACRKPEQPFWLGAYFALKPPAELSPASPSLSSVIATFGGEISTDTFGFGAIIDSVAQILSAVYGTLAPPWDTSPGVYNQHDDAARSRFRRDLPTLDEKFHQYFRYKNVLDEFDGPVGPYVLFNFSAEVRSEALKKFPQLFHFYQEVGPAVTTTVEVLDDNNHYWMRSGFEHGRVWMNFMVRDGKLSAFDASYHPVGEPLALASLRHGVTHTHSSIRLLRLGMTFGLSNLNFTNYFTRDESTTSFQSRMDGVPVVVAPPGIRQGADFVAGEFMRRVAMGSGGMHSEVESKALAAGLIRFTSKTEAEFMYSPALEFFAKLADSVADADNAQVRKQERALALEFLDAFVKDYNNARPQILTLDRDPALSK